MVKILTSQEKLSSSDTSQIPLVDIENFASQSQMNRTQNKSTNKVKLTCYLLVVLFFVAVFVKCLTFRRSMELQINEFPRVQVYNGKTTSKLWEGPPPHQNYPSVARYVLHIAEWGSLSTISTHKGIEGYPFNNVFSVSDGPYRNGTGIPYFYLTELELSVKDLKENDKASFTVSLAQTDYCSQTKMDPEDPRCAHIIFTGKISRLEKGSEEEKFAKDSLFSRHYEMDSWPHGHRWFFAKLDITHIYVLDYFGGAQVVDVKDYFNVILNFV